MCPICSSHCSVHPSVSAAFLPANQHKVSISRPHQQNNAGQKLSPDILITSLPQEYSTNLELTNKSNLTFRKQVCLVNIKRGFPGPTAMFLDLSHTKDPFKKFHQFCRSPPKNYFTSQLPQVHLIITLKAGILISNKGFCIFSRSLTFV
jgi:hypothetical protein